MSLRVFWGDLHSHCAVSYGHGTPKQALARARQQLDFCSITGHAFWPDMPTDRQQYGDIIDYHNVGFARLARNWPELVALHQQATQAKDFIAFPSYEWHSLEYGDHNVYVPTPELSLTDAPDVHSLKQALLPQQGIAIPHHIGYRAGYRGINWNAYEETGSPFVEIFSLHGCSVSDQAPYPMLHDMGPRDFGSTAEAGWRRGHHFGIVGGTDHHAAYPGSHGDGRMGVLAPNLTREALWDGFLNRRVYAATGDKIEAHLTLNDAPIGSILTTSAKRHLAIEVAGLDTLHVVELRKNGRPFRSWAPVPPETSSTPGRYRLRLTWGWGKKTETTSWQAECTLSDGEIRHIEPCFSGQAIVAPQGENNYESLPDLPHAVTNQDHRSVAWRSITQGNLSMRHATTQSLVLDLEAPEDARLTLTLNGHEFTHSVGELRQGSQTHFLRGWLTEAIQIGRLIPIDECTFKTELTDQPSEPEDRYQLIVSQRNNQWAWLSPIWVQQ